MGQQNKYLPKYVRSESGICGVRLLDSPLALFRDVNVRHWPNSALGTCYCAKSQFELRSYCSIERTIKATNRAILINLLL
jgi:hypothetical protein